MMVRFFSDIWILSPLKANKKSSELQSLTPLLLQNLLGLRMNYVQSVILQQKSLKLFQGVYPNEIAPDCIVVIYHALYIAGLTLLKLFKGIYPVKIT